MNTRLIAAACLAAGLATAMAMPAYSARVSRDHATGPTGGGSGVGSAESCATARDLGCNIAASDYSKTFKRERHAMYIAPSAVRHHVVRTQ